MLADPAILETLLRRWLPTQRWFGDKARGVTACRVVENIPLSGDSNILVVRVDFEEGESSDYVVPMVDGEIEGATESPMFMEKLGRLVAGTAIGQSSITRTAFVAASQDLGELVAKPLDVEQSNTSIRYGSDWVVKLSRKLSYGPSPELELSAVMNRWTGPRCTPQLAAALHVRTDAGIAPLAAQAEFIPNEGDGWALVLALLRSEFANGQPPTVDSPSMRDVDAIAELTADMHSALTLDPWRAEVAVERITRDDAHRWEASVRGSLHAGLSLLDSFRHVLSGRSRDLAELVSSVPPTIRTKLAGFDALVGGQRLRVHGDYHLAQVLRGPDGRYVAIDFDGEPQRSLEERRAKYSPLRDVAGMLSSFSYAVGTVHAESGEVVGDTWFPEWEQMARAAFVSTYVERLSSNGSDLLPSGTERVRQSLAALELEKAAYMIHYELNNRPDWLWIPLSQLVKMG